MRLAEAKKKADEIVATLSPFCKRIEIAGSIRREQPEIGDIEIVLIPDTGKLYQYRDAVNTYTKIRGEPLGKYTQRLHPSGCVIDIFICSPSTWACIYFIRTGSSNYVYSIMCRQKEKLIRFIDGQLWFVDGDGKNERYALDNIKEEIDVFNALGLDWVEPRERV